MTHRFNILLGLPFAMLAALGVKSLLVLRLFKNKTSLLILIISAMILSGYWLYPYRTSQVWEKPGWYHQLAQEPDHFAILDLPMNPRIWDKNYMHYQLTHGKPLVEGHVSRTTRDAFAFLDSTPFLKKLRHENVMDPSIVDVSNQLRVLAEANVRYIVLHKHLVKNRQVAKWRDWLAFQPYHEDEELVVYRTEPRFREDFDFECEMTNEIGLIHVSFTPEEVSQGESVNVAASWGSKGAPGCDYDVCIKLINPSDTVPQSICYPISSNWPTSNWGMDEVVRGVYDMQLDHSLEPGTYTLSIVLIKDDTGLEVGQTVKLGKLIVRAPLQ